MPEWKSQPLQENRKRHHFSAKPMGTDSYLESSGGCHVHQCVQAEEMDLSAWPFWGAVQKFEETMST